MATHEIKIIIVYGTNKALDIKSDESIGAVKLAAMGQFGIPESEQNSYILRAKVDGTEEQLDEAKTVEAYHLHQDQKVTLAAGTPFGQA
jgi:hypothetical protein